MNLMVPINKLYWYFIELITLNSKFRVQSQSSKMANSVEIPIRYSLSSNQELEKYLKPIAILMKVFGFNMPLSGQLGDCLQNRFVILLGWMFLLTNLLSCIALMYIVSFSYDVSMKRSLTISWTLTITYINDIMFKILIHLYLLVIVGATTKQLQLIKILQKLSFPGLKIRQFPIPITILLLLVRPY